MTDEPTRACLRDDRAFVQVVGEAAREFLQGLLSQDVENISTAEVRYGALLTPQGKFLHDLFLIGLEDGVLLECEADRVDDLAVRLNRYRLRAKIEIEAMDGWRAALAWGGDLLGLDLPAGGAVRRGEATLYVDPRLEALGLRIVGPAAAVEAAIADAAPGAVEDYHLLRMSLGVPEGARDIAVDKGFLLESGFDELNGVDWKKGCYVGQELTARTKYRGLVKRRLMPVRIDGDAPEIGADLAFAGKNAGEMKSSVKDRGIALVRLDAWRAAVAADQPLEAGATRLWPERPDWARFE